MGHERMFSPGAAVALDVPGHCKLVLFETHKQQPLYDL